MEALLKLSGLLNEEDGDKTDLATLEKKLANKSSGGEESTPIHSPNKPPSTNTPQATSTSHNSPPHFERLPTPQSSGTSPKPREEKKKEEEVEALSDMMCSLVTNNCGESRYIGITSIPLT